MSASTIAVNSEEGEIVRGLMYELLDHYLGLPPRRLAGEIARLHEAADRARRSPRCRRAAAKPAKVGPSLPLARYAGDFSDPWYGTITIREENGGLVIDFQHSPGLHGDARTLAI